MPLLLCRLLLTAATLLTLLPARATVRLPRLVGEHMVLQHGVPLQLWGWAAPGEAVQVFFQGKTYAAKAGGADGKWTVALPAFPVGGPYELRVKGRNELLIKDVLLGDVWLASGQSNMEWPVREASNAAAEIAAASFPQIRRIDVPNVAALTPQADFGGSGWQVCSPQTVAEFSAVAYFFARRLQQHNPKVPIGLITAEWGGTPAEAWTSAAALRALPDFAAPVAALAALQGSIAEAEAAYLTRLQAWQASPASRDRGRRPGQLNWADPAFTPTSWPSMELPGLWENQTEALRNFDGVVWLRREVSLTAAEAGQDARLSLARIDDDDSTWVNGVLVGSTRGYNTPRQYSLAGYTLKGDHNLVPLLQRGRNVIVVRVDDTGGAGGIWGAAAELQLRTATRRIALAGPWLYQPAFDPATKPPPPFSGGPQVMPTTLFNGLIAPLRPYALKGVIWYQGESNAGRAEQYRRLFPALVRDWRAQWQQPALPFLFVQIAGFEANGSGPAESVQAELREAQQLALALPGTGMATAVDLGDSTDIHPRNKQEVGRRLALVARRVAYQEKGVVDSGPVFDKMTVAGNTLRLTFRNPGTGLVLKNAGGPYLQGFAIAGADRRFGWARGELRGDTLLLHSPAVPAPVAVRYAWGNTPFINLYNSEGLPAPPFRTDTWPGLTAGKK